MKTLIKVLKYGIVLVGAGLTICYFANWGSFDKIWSYLATMALPFATDLLRITGLKISKRFEIAYLLFIIPAMIMGIDFNLYKIIYPFDKIVHTLSGVLSAFAAREIIKQTSAMDKPWFRSLFSLCFVAFTALIWECYEFLMDQVTGTNMQELIIPGIADTMYDMIVAMIGGLIGTVLAFPLTSRKK